jgi:hypothetical protein
VKLSRFVVNIWRSGEEKLFPVPDCAVIAELFNWLHLKTFQMLLHIIYRKIKTLNSMVLWKLPSATLFSPVRQKRCEHIHVPLFQETPEPPLSAKDEVG